MSLQPPTFDEAASPWDLPHLDFTLYRQDAADPAGLERFLAHLEDLVPGAVAWAVPEGWRAPYKKRLRKLLEKPERLLELPPIGHYVVQVPAPGGWLAEDALAAAGHSFVAASVGAAGPFAEDEDARRRQLADGCRLVEAAFAVGLLTDAARCAAPFQLRGAARIVRSPAAMLIYPAGAGKSLTVLLGLAAREAAGLGRGALIVCPARARAVWHRQIGLYASWRPFRLLPEGLRGEEAWPSLDGYLAACADAGAAPVVLVGAESAADHLDELRRWATGRQAPSALVADEIHEWAGDPRRWSGVANADGTVDWTVKATARTGQPKRTAVAMLLSRLRCLRVRVASTATPFGEGLPRRMYGPCDVVWPGVHGLGYGPFARRYCGGTPGEYGGLEDKGSTNLDELRSRASFYLHEVAYSESHRDLPPLRVEVLWLEKSDLNGPEIRLERAAEAAARKAAKDFSSSDDLVELRLAAAAARKARWVVFRVLDALRSGPAKVVVFANRHEHVERWADLLEKAVAGANQGERPVGPVHLAWGHGANPASPELRAEMAERFGRHPGPCVFVGTGQAFGSSLNGFEHADLAILAALPWRADELVQWRGRFDRHGGRPTLLSIPLASGSYDETVAVVLTRKLGPIEAFLASEETRGLRDRFLRADDVEQARREVLAALGVAL